MESPNHLNLTPSEQRMWDTVMAGQPCVFGDDDPRELASPDAWGPERTVRGHVLAELLMAAGATESASIRQIQIQGARVTGELDVSHAELRAAVEARRCLFEDDLILWFTRARALQMEECVLASVTATGARIEGLLGIFQSRVLGNVLLIDAKIGHSVVFAGSTISGYAGQALSANRLEVDGDVFLSDGFISSGAVLFPDARIGAALNCSGGRFENPGGLALAADGASIAGAVRLSPGFCATGEVRLPGAQIGGQLACSGGRFENPERRALTVDGARIQNGVDLSSGFYATGDVRLTGAWISGSLDCAESRIEGCLSCTSAHVIGSLICANAKFGTEKADALYANHADIRGDAILGHGFHARGEVHLLGTRVGGNLICDGGRFENADGNAISAYGAHIRGGTFLQRGFHATGTVELLGAQIDGMLSCSDGHFENPGNVAMSLRNISAYELRLVGPNLQIVGEISLFGAHISVLADAPEALPESATVLLDGFVYERISPYSPRDVASRLEWLERQPESFQPQPFDQLAAVFRRSGHDQEAKDVLVAKRRKRRETLQRLRSRCWDWFLDKSVLYGWQPWRPLVGGSVVLLAVLGLVIGAQAMGQVTSPSDVMSSYHPLIHVLDVFLPVVDLGVESRWTIDTSSGGWFAWLVMACLWFLKLVGWGTVTLALAAVTGIVRRQ